MEAIIFRIDKSKKNRLKASAALNGKSLTALLGEIVEQYLKETKEA